MEPKLLSHHWFGLIVVAKLILYLEELSTLLVQKHLNIIKICANVNFVKYDTYYHEPLIKYEISKFEPCKR